MVIFTQKEANEHRVSPTQTYMPLALEISSAAVPPSCSSRCTGRSQHQPSAELGWCTCGEKAQLASISSWFTLCLKWLLYFFSYKQHSCVISGLWLQYCLLIQIFEKQLTRTAWNTFQSSVLHKINAKDIKNLHERQTGFFSLVFSTFIHKAKQVASLEEPQEDQVWVLGRLARRIKAFQWQFHHVTTETQRNPGSATVCCLCLLCPSNRHSVHWSHLPHWATSDCSTWKWADRHSFNGNKTHE